MNIKLELTPKEVEVLEIALKDIFNKDSSHWLDLGYTEVDTIPDAAESILDSIEKQNQLELLKEQYQSLKTNNND